MINTLLINLVLTIFLEAIILIRAFPEDIKKSVAYSFIINSLTLPLAFYGIIYLHISFLPLEIAIILLETLLIKFLFKTNYKRAFFVSIIANVITALIGVFLSLI